jgi:metal-responsive CopG/Arc/MetJ family transcriptional regulator
MSSVKTAISLEEPLFEQAENAARELKVSRSRLFAMAIEEFLRKHENRKLLAAINASVEPSDPEERAVRSALRQRQRSRMEGDW